MNVEYTNGIDTLIIKEKEAILIDDRNNAYRIEKENIKEIKLIQEANQVLSGKGDIKIIGTEFNIVLYNTKKAGKIAREIENIYFNNKTTKKEEKQKTEPKTQTEQIEKTENKTLTEQEKFYKRANTAQEIGFVTALTIAGIIIFFIIIAISLIFWLIIFIL